MDLLLPAAVIAALLIGLGIGLAIGTSAGRKSAETRAGALDVEVGLLRQQAKEAEARRADDTKVTSLIESLQERVKELQVKAATADVERAKADEAIHQQIDQMRQGNASLVAETKRLAGTLSNSANRGRYGEMQLEQLLSHCGLQQEVHFRKQSKNQDGQIPDVIVNLPGGGEIFIDSKFPFDQFWAAATTDSPEAQKSHQLAHAQDLLKHAEALAKRGYHHKETSPDFVVLFAPFESILAVALEADPQLLDKMFSKQVVIATPTTMLALLRTIGYGYSQHDSAANAAKIRDLAILLLKRAATVHSKLDTLGKRLRSVASAYSELITTADNSIFVPARKMRDMGISAPSTFAALDGEVHVREFRPRTSGELDSADSDSESELIDDGPALKNGSTTLALTGGDEE